VTEKAVDMYWAPKMKIGDARSRQEAESAFFEAHISLLSQPRHLMSQLRDIMAGIGHAEDKLNQIVQLVSGHLQADVCSCYVLRENQSLELFATIGLEQSAVHKIKLKIGEGLVGNIAAHACPLSLADARSNPNFVYFPETGEEAYASFCGVPILRGQKVRGVIVVQNKKRRHYGEELIELLQTVAMIVAELIMSGELVPRQELQLGQEVHQKPHQLTGDELSAGFSMGQAVLYDPILSINDIVADDPKAEKRHLKRSILKMHSAIDVLVSKSEKSVGKDSETVEILETYQMFSRDKGWIKRIEETIDKGLSAEASVQRVKNEMHARLSKSGNAYMLERLHDIEDLSNRLLTYLMDKEEGTDHLKKDIVVIARSMGPAALLDYDPKYLKGVLLEGGSNSGHVAIIARAMGIPVLGQCGDIISSITNEDQIIIDTGNKVAYVNPSEDVVNLYSAQMLKKRKVYSLDQDTRDKPAITKDNVEVSLFMNAGLSVEMPLLHNTGAAGIGLYRTELSFMGWSKYPRVVLQADLYGRIMDQANGKPVVFRTLDIGGDKPLPYFKAPEEENPAMGWRAIRIGLDRPAVLRTQCRAFIMGAKGRPLKILLPLVSEVAELDQARVLIDMEVKRAEKRGDPLPEKLEIGVMIEVPSLLWQMDSLLKDVDFIAIGTNDLKQYLFAVDDRSDATRQRYDCLSPPMLNALSMIADKCKKANVPVSVCGEMAGNPLEAMVLIALGFENLSMNAQSIADVKEMVGTMEIKTLKPYLKKLMASREHSLRDKIKSFALDHKIEIGHGRA